MAFWAKLFFMLLAGMSASFLYFRADIEDFVRMDACLDEGGCWAVRRRVCVHAQEACDAERGEAEKIRLQIPFG
ncbi:hypothetical protein [Methylocystis parvus]|uniref:hypothetical protein n=1 Tax=Methylocystis parvus TaxID=134 RepID=UPI003C78ABEA